MGRIPVRIVFVVSLICGIGFGGMGCSEDRAPSRAEPTPPAVPARATDVEYVAWMEAHYTAAIRAHDALQQGVLSRFRERLTEASTLSSPPAMPEPWKPLLDDFRSAAGNAADATTLNEAAEGFAPVVLACGQCHAALGTGPVYPAPAPGEAAGALRSAMLDHKWSMERLWEGVTGPWELAWARGSELLAETPVFSEGEVPGDLLRRQEALLSLGREAREAGNHAERAAIYGRLLATCGDCHRAAGVEFEAPR